MEINNTRILQAFNIVHDNSNCFSSGVDYEDFLTRLAILFPETVIDTYNFNALEYEVKEIWKTKGKIHAIKHYRDFNLNTDLRQCKENTEKICGGLKTPLSNWR